MAHTISARKRVKQSYKKNMANKAYKSVMKTKVKNFLKAVEAGDQAVAKSAFDEAAKTISKIASKGVIHKNQAARRISRLALRLNSAQ